MKTRAQVVASHCIITRVPVEIITQIFKSHQLLPSDLQAASQTCRYLRARSHDSVVRESHLQAFREQSSQLQLYRPHLPFLSNLTLVSLPFPLLTNSLFKAVYDHTSLFTLDIAGDVRTDLISHQLDLTLRTFSFPRPTPLTVSKVQSGMDPADLALTKALVDFLLFHSVRIPFLKLAFSLPIPLTASSLAYPPLEHLRELKVATFPEGFDAAVSFLEVSMRTQRCLDNVSLRVVDGLYGFRLDEHSWVSWEGKLAKRPDASLGAAWAGVKLGWLRLDFWRDDTSNNFDVQVVQMEFFGEAIVTPEMSRELALQLKHAFSLTFSSSESLISWPDWTSTVEHFKTELDALTSIYIESPLTPSATVTTTLACSSACDSKLATSHYSLHLASELVGGYEAVWELSYHLNVRRLEQLGPVFKQEEGGLVSWGLEKRGVELVGLERVVEQSGVWTRFDDTLASVPTADKVKLCDWFGCGKVEEGKDPISALRECGVEEVRAALVVAGFDLDAFDSRSPTQPIDQHSFETFLRSNPT